MRHWVLAAVVCGACVHSDATVCSSGRICPTGTTCRTAAGIEICASLDQLEACAGADDGTACTFAGVSGTCFDGICLPSACGNLRVDATEVCDDGNDVVGDGCSQSCRSDETCGNGIIDEIALVDGAATAAEQCDDANLVAHDGCSSTCRSEFPAWARLESGAPPVRTGVAMVYDAARDRVVAFGGISDQHLGDMWEWNGRGWIEVLVTLAPHARTGHAMAYDGHGATTVLFGGDAGGIGIGGGVPSDDTWLWDGAMWTNPGPATRPSPRLEHRMAYDAQRRRVVLFGGSRPTINPLINNVHADTWEWYEGDWHLVCGDEVCGPPRRYLHALAFDPRRGVIVLFGGWQGPSTDVVLQDTWEFDGAWRLVDVATKPSARYGAALTFDPLTNKLLLSGGVDLDGTYLADTWLWDGQQWQPGSAVDAPAIAFHGAAMDAIGGGSIAFGGSDQDAAQTNDTFAWSGDTWKPKTITPTPNRTSAAAVFDARRGRTVLFGGFDNGSTSPDTYELDGQAWSLAATTGPPARWDHAMAFDPARNNVVMFGGYASSVPSADTWTWDGTTWTRRVDGPAPRTGHVMAFDGTRVVAFGGNSNGSFTAETWAWDGTAWSVLPVTGPSARIRASVAFDPIRRRVVLFGGVATDGLLDDTWEWDGASWQRVITPSSPPPRSDAALAWDHARRRIVLFAGAGSGESNDAWEFDGQTWTPLPLLSRPSPRSTHVMFEAGHGVLSLWMNELWRLRWENFTRDEACTAALDLDGDGLHGCDDPDCALVCARCGDGICDPIESCRSCPGDCGACNRCGDFSCDPSESAATCPGDCS